MAEIISNKKPHGKKRVLKNIKVDLTPMVDLGFLLITFFIVTTTLQAKHVLKITVPKESKDSTVLAESTTLTFVLEQNDSIRYYKGTAPVIQFDKFTAMRNIILNTQSNLTNNNIDKNLLTIIIKPTNNCTYKNLVNTLDEITITNCTRYFIANP